MAPPRFDPKHPTALAMYCSDGRFTDAVEALLHGLGHPRLDTLTIPGGAALLEMTSADLDAIKIMRSSISFLVTGHHIKHVVLIAHEGCGYYKHRFPYDSPEHMKKRQITDLNAAHRWVKNHHDVIVTKFYAAPSGDEVSFETVE